MKRIYLLLGGIIVIGLFGLAIFFFSKNSGLPGVLTGTTGSLPTAPNIFGGNNTNTSPSSSTADTSPVIGSGFNIVSNENVVDYSPEASGTIVAATIEGAIERLGPGIGASSTVLSSTSIPAIASASFSYDGKKFLVSSGDPANPQTKVFDVKTASWTSLPDGMISARWFPADYRIAYLANGKTMTLLTRDLSNVKNAPVRVASLNARDLAISWIGKSQIVLSDRPSSYAPNSIMVYDLANKTLQPVILEKTGLESAWSRPLKNGSSSLGIIFMKSPSGQGYSLALNDISGDLLQSFNFVTLPEKCSFVTTVTATSTQQGKNKTAPTTATTSTTTTTTAKAVNAPALYLYCGVPRDQASFSAQRLPDDYDQMALFTSDSIYRINLSTGSVDTLWDDGTQNMDVSDLKVVGNMLFFVNRYDDRIYSLSIGE